LSAAENVLFYKKRVFMKVLVQRVSRASVTVDGVCVGSIACGYMVLVGCCRTDTGHEARILAHKTVNLRIFEDEHGKMNLSLDDVNGSVLAISQFTLYTDTRKGNRPGFYDAADPASAEEIYNIYVDALRRSLGAERVQT